MTSRKGHTTTGADGHPCAAASRAKTAAADASDALRAYGLSLPNRLPAKPAFTQMRLIDVREDDEWRAGQAAGANLGKGIIERDIEATVPDKATELILYCGGGYRSALAADVLQQMGYANVWSLAGGWKAWKDSGAPVRSDQ